MLCDKTDTTFIKLHYNVSGDITLLKIIILGLVRLWTFLKPLRTGNWLRFRLHAENLPPLGRANFKPFSKRSSFRETSTTDKVQNNNLKQYRTKS
jgi:hypothetical protein